MGIILGIIAIYSVEYFNTIVCNPHYKYVIM